MGYLDLNGLSHYHTKITSYITAKLDAIKALIPTKVSQLTNDSGFTKTTVAASTTNGNLLVNSTETKVYTLPTASDAVVGGVKIGTNITNASGVISVANGTTSAKGVVQLTDSTTSTSTTTAATAKSVATALTSAKSYADTNLATAKAYTDTVFSNLTGGALPEALDTLKEIASAVEDNADLIDAIQSAVTNIGTITTTEIDTLFTT
jgi:hypothetical protein